MSTKAARVGIVIDEWKLPIFERLLTQHGYQFENAGTMGGGALILRVVTENVVALAEVLKQAQAEAARTRGAKT